MDAKYFTKLEQVFSEYEQSQDLELAFDLFELSDADKEKLRKDPILLARIALSDAKQKKALVGKLKSLINNASSEAVQLAALKEFGRTVYAQRFEDKLKGDLNLNHKGRVTIVDDV